MKFEEIMNCIKKLAMSQGMYARLLDDIDELQPSDLERLIKYWEDKDFDSELDFILWYES